MYNFSQNSLHNLYHNILLNIKEYGIENNIRDNRILSIDHVTAELTNIQNRVLFNEIFNIGFALDELYCILNEIPPRSYVSTDQLQRTMGTSSRNMFFGNELREALSRWSLTKIYELFQTDINTNKAFLDLNTRRPTLHVPCLIGVHFYFRNNQFCCNLISRGTELNYGFIYDTFLFTQIQHILYGWLKAYYPDIELGSFYYTTTNLHLYVDEDHRPIVEGNDVSIENSSETNNQLLSFDEYIQQMSLLYMLVEYMYKHMNNDDTDIDNGFYSTHKDTLYFIDKVEEFNLNSFFRKWFKIIHHQYMDNYYKHSDGNYFKLNLFY